jgi:hypothetical protein
MLRCENHYFQIKKDYFCGLLDCAFIYCQMYFQLFYTLENFFIMMFIMGSGGRPKIIVLRLNSDHDLLMFQLKQIAMIC